MGVVVGTGPGADGADKPAASLAFRVDLLVWGLDFPTGCCYTFFLLAGDEEAREGVRAGSLGSVRRIEISVEALRALSSSAMEVAMRDFCCCRRRSPALPAFEAKVGRLAPNPSRVAVAAFHSARLWSTSSTSTLSTRGVADRRSFAPSKWGLSDVGAVASLRAYQRDGDGGGGPNGTVTEVHGQNSGAKQQQQQLQERGALPRPPIVAWEKDLANAVQLIGRVGRDIELKTLESGKILAMTSLAVKRGTKSPDDASWFWLEIWDDLAEIAAHHVSKGELIFVTGRIVVDKRTKDDVTHTNVKVVVRDLCFVEATSELRQAYGQSDEFITAASSQSQPAPANADYSNRVWQRPANQPAQGTSGQQGSSSTSNDPAAATERKWQDYFSDPTQWWDNRENKRNPKAPDFRHRSTQEALWIESRNNPPWVAQKLADLDEKRGQQRGDFGGPGRPEAKKSSSLQDSDFLY